MEIDRIFGLCIKAARRQGLVTKDNEGVFGLDLLDAFEALVLEGWVILGFDPSRPASKTATADLAYVLDMR